MDPWKRFDEHLRSFSGQPEELSFGAKSRAKERTNKYGNTKGKTRFYESTIRDDARDQIGEDLPLFKDPHAELSLQILWLCTQRKGDISNHLKSLEDALNKVAYPDDRQLIHVNGLFVEGEPENRTLVRIRQRESQPN